MTPELYLLFGLLFYTAGVLFFGVKYLQQKSRADYLQKERDGNLTDAEMLHRIAEIYQSVDFKKVNNDLLNDWQNFVKNLINEPEKVERIEFIEVSPNKDKVACNNCKSFYKFGVHVGHCLILDRIKIDHDYCKKFEKKIADNE